MLQPTEPDHTLDTIYHKKSARAARRPPVTPRATPGSSGQPTERTGHERRGHDTHAPPCLAHQYGCCPRRQLYRTLSHYTPTDASRADPPQTRSLPKAPRRTSRRAATQRSSAELGCGVGGARPGKLGAVTCPCRTRSRSSRPTPSPYFATRSAHGFAAAHASVVMTSRGRAATASRRSGRSLWRRETAMVAMRVG